jgi:hypothetical protein
MNIFYTTFKSVSTLIFLSTVFCFLNGTIHAQKSSENIVEVEVEEDVDTKPQKIIYPKSSRKEKHHIIHITRHVMGKPVKFVVKTLGLTAQHVVKTLDHLLKHTGKIVVNTTKFTGERVFHTFKNGHKYILLTKIQKNMKKPRAQNVYYVEDVQRIEQENLKLHKENDLLKKQQNRSQSNHESILSSKDFLNLEGFSTYDKKQRTSFQKQEEPIEIEIENEDDSDENINDE